MEYEKEPTRFRETIIYAENQELEPMRVSIGDAPDSIEQVINGEYEFLSLMGVNALYSKFFKILYKKVFPHLPQNWDMDKFIMETCTLIPSDVKFKSDEEVLSDLMYETIDFIIESYFRWEPYVLEIDSDDEIAYNIQLMESFLIQEKVLAKVFYKNKYIETIIKTILDLFKGLRLRTTLILPTSSNKKIKQGKPNPTHLIDIWLEGYEKDVIETTYRNVIQYLHDEERIIIQNGDILWTSKEGLALNILLSGFLYKCQEAGYIKLHCYSGPKLKEICENTFNIKMGDSKAFQPSSLSGDGKDYSQHFKLMPIFKN